MAQACITLRSTDGRIDSMSMPKAIQHSVVTVHHAVFHPNGHLLATINSAQTVSVWDAAFAHTKRSLHGPTSLITALVTSDDGTFIACGTHTGHVHVWLWETLEPACATWRPHADRISSLAFFTGFHNLLCSAGEDNTLCVSRADTGVVLAAYTLGGMPHHLAASPTTGLLTACVGLNVVTVAPRDGIAQSPPYAAFPTCIAHAGTAVGVFAVGCADGTVVVHGTHGEPSILGSCGDATGAHAARVTALEFSPGDAVLLSAAQDCTVRVWQWRTGTVLATASKHTNWVSAACFHPIHCCFATGSHDGVVKLWRLDGAFLGSLRGHTGYIRSVVFHPHGASVVSAAADGTARSWQLPKGVRDAPRWDDGSVAAALRGAAAGPLAARAMSPSRLLGPSAATVARSRTPSDRRRSPSASATGSASPARGRPSSSSQGQREAPLLVVPPHCAATSASELRRLASFTVLRCLPSPARRSLSPRAAAPDDPAPMAATTGRRSASPVAQHRAPPPEPQAQQGLGATAEYSAEFSNTGAMSATAASSLAAVFASAAAPIDRRRDVAVVARLGNHRDAAAPALSLRDELAYHEEPPRAALRSGSPAAAAPHSNNSAAGPLQGGRPAAGTTDPKLVLSTATAWAAARRDVSPVRVVSSSLLAAAAAAAPRSRSASGDRQPRASTASNDFAFESSASLRAAAAEAAVPHNATSRSTSRGNNATNDGSNAFNILGAYVHAAAAVAPGPHLVGLGGPSTLGAAALAARCARAFAACAPRHHRLSLGVADHIAAPAAMSMLPPQRPFFEAWQAAPWEGAATAAHSPLRALPRDVLAAAAAAGVVSLQSPLYAASLPTLLPSYVGALLASLRGAPRGGASAPAAAPAAHDAELLRHLESAVLTQPAAFTGACYRWCATVVPAPAERSEVAFACGPAFCTTDAEAVAAPLGVGAPEGPCGTLVVVLAAPLGGARRLGAPDAIYLGDPSTDVVFPPSARFTVDSQRKAAAVAAALWPAEAAAVATALVSTGDGASPLFAVWLLHEVVDPAAAPRTATADVSRGRAVSAATVWA